MPAIARSHARALSLIEQSHTLATMQDACVLAHDPPPGAKWVYFWSCEVAAPNTVAFEVQLNHDTAGVVQNLYNLTAQETASPVDYYTVGGMGFGSYGAAPGKQTLSVEYRTTTAGNTVRIRNVRIVGFELGPNDVYVEGSATQTSGDGVGNTDIASTTITLDLSGEAGNTDWLILASVESQSADASTADTKLFVDAIVLTNAQHNKATSNFVPSQFQDFFTLSNASHTIKLQIDLSTVHRGRRGKVLCLKKDDLLSLLFNEQRTANSGTTASWTDGQTYAPTIDKETHHLVLATWQKTVSSTTISGYSRFTDGNTVWNENYNEAAIVNQRFSAIAADVKQLPAGARTTFKFQRRSETTGVTTGVDEMCLALIRLDDGAPRYRVPQMIHPGRGVLDRARFMRARYGYAEAAPVVQGMEAVIDGGSELSMAALSTAFGQAAIDGMAAEAASAALPIAGALDGLGDLSSVSALALQAALEASGELSPTIVGAVQAAIDGASEPAATALTTALASAAVEASSEVPVSGALALWSVLDGAGEVLASAAIGVASMVAALDGGSDLAATLIPVAAAAIEATSEPSALPGLGLSAALDGAGDPAALAALGLGAALDGGSEISATASLGLVSLVSVVDGSTDLAALPVLLLAGALDGAGEGSGLPVLALAATVESAAEARPLAALLAWSVLDAASDHAASGFATAFGAAAIEGVVLVGAVGLVPGQGEAGVVHVLDVAAYPIVPLDLDAFRLRSAVTLGFTLEALDLEATRVRVSDAPAFTIEISDRKT